MKTGQWGRDKVEIESSYLANDLGAVLRLVVLAYAPKKIVEFGVYHGYSTVHMAQGLRTLGEGHIDAYDLWDLYEYNHTTMNIAQQNIDAYGVGDLVTLRQANYYEWLENPTEFDMLHIDISNNGDIIEQTLTKLAPQIDNGSIVVFEGGSVERDNVQWMREFNKRPINPLLKKFEFRILDHQFPSISIMGA
jgi:predicted O-methyltransferase YrrM